MHILSFYHKCSIPKHLTPSITTISMRYSTIWLQQRKYSTILYLVVLIPLLKLTPNTPLQQNTNTALKQNTNTPPKLNRKDPPVRDESILVLVLPAVVIVLETFENKELS